MSKIKIQQTRSRIGRPKDQKRTLEALGFKKLNQVGNVAPTVTRSTIPTICTTFIVVLYLKMCYFSYKKLLFVFGTTLFTWISTYYYCALRERVVLFLF